MKRFFFIHTRQFWYKHPSLVGTVSSLKAVERLSFPFKMVYFPVFFIAQGVYATVQIADTVADKNGISLSGKTVAVIPGIDLIVYHV